MRSKTSKTFNAKKVPKGRCIAIIGDIIGSRDLGSQRSYAQKKLFLFLDEINKRYRDAIISTFTVTAGDEFQGLICKGDLIPDFIWYLESSLKYRVRLGIGCGRLSTQLQPVAIGMDGPVWHAAREGIEDALKNSKYGGVFKGFNDKDEILLNGFARILHAQRKRLTEKQVRIIDLLRDGLNQIEVAEKLKITRQAVSHHVKIAEWNAYEEANNGWKRILNLYDFRKQWPI
jgi:predicted DNA-binding protein YlxM (UPF0122 family)